MDADEPAEDDDAITEEKLFWFLATAYILRAVGLLRPDKHEKLASLTAHWTSDWGAHIRMQLDINDTFIRNVYGNCTEFKSPFQSVAFILRGLGCPSAEARMAEFNELQGLE